MPIIECPWCHETVKIKRINEWVKCKHCKKELRVNGDGKAQTKVQCSTCTSLCIVDADARIDKCNVCSSSIDLSRIFAREVSLVSGKPCVIAFGENDFTIGYKHPIENFYAGSKVNVFHTQEAVFYKNGKILRRFGEGQHILDVDRIRTFSKMLNLADGDATFFSSTIYFIRTTPFLNIPWGLSVQCFEPRHRIPFSVGLNGALDFVVEDVGKFIEKVMGQKNEVTLSEFFIISDAEREARADFNEKITSKSLIIPQMQSEIGTYISKILSSEKNEIDVFDLEQHKDVFAEAIQGYVNRIFRQYGLALCNDLNKEELDTGEEEVYKKTAFHIHSFILNGSLIEEYRKIHKRKTETEGAIAEEELKRRLIGEQGKTTITEIQVANEARTFAMSNQMLLELMNKIALIFANHLQGKSEADIFSEYGADAKDILNAMVDVSRNAALGNAASNIHGGGTSSGTIGDIFGSYGGLKILDDLLKKNRLSNDGNNGHEWRCKCGSTNTGNFCGNCGTPRK